MQLTWRPSGQEPNCRSEQSILYRITTTGSYHELGAMTSTQNIDGDLMEASDGTLWACFTPVPTALFSSVRSIVLACFTG
jgi:hypothetical protein